MASHHIRDIFTTHRMWHTDMGERKESSCFLLPGFTFTNRWALAWEHAPGCYLNEDAGPLQTAQSKEWPSRLHIFTYSRIHDNKVPYPLSGSAIEYLIDRCPNVNHSLSGKYSRHFAFSFFSFFFADILSFACTHCICSLTGSQVMHIFLAWVFACAFTSCLNWHQLWLPARCFT